MKYKVEDMSRLDQPPFEILPSDPKSQQLAYKMAAALDKKFKGKVVGLRTQRFETERLLFEFTLSVGSKVVSTAYSEGWFEDINAEQAKWLATRIYTELMQRIDWAARGKA